MTGTPLTVSPIEVQTMGYPCTCDQFLILCLGVDTTQRGEERRRETRKTEPGRRREVGGHTKLVVPSIGLLSAQTGARGRQSLLDYTLVNNYK